MNKNILKHLNKINTWIIGKNITHLIYSYTQDNTIFCKIGIDDYNIYLEIYLNEDGEEEETVINIYKDGDAELCFGGAIEKCLETITKTISIYDIEYNKVYSMIVDGKYDEINQHLESLKTETNRGILRTALMVLKPFRNEEIIKDNYNQVAELLRSESTNNRI
jgi:hypothetical protein